MAYVMLGRTQQLEDIHIVEKTCKFDPTHIRVCPIALEESNRIHNAFQAIKAKEELVWQSHFTISYLNVNRLLRNLRHVKADHLLMKSNAVCLAETWLHANDVVELDGYQNCLVNGGDGKGLAAFSQLESNEWQRFSNEKISAILMVTEKVNVIYLYLSQQFDCDVLKKRLDSWIDTEKMVAVMGDMNIDYLDQKHPLKDYLAGKNFVQLVKKPTHERGNLLDHVYVNPKLLITEPIVTQRSVYFSDHDVIVLQIPQEYM